MQLPGLVQFRKCTIADRDLAEAVVKGMNEMYTDPVSVPTRQIPARPNEDFDLITGELIVRYLEKTELLKQIRSLDIQHKIEHGAFFLPDEIRAQVQKILSDSLKISDL